MDVSVAVAVVVGLLQGVFEWLPISSEGNITLYLTLVAGLPEATAAQFSLFLHAGTAVSATAYYRRELADLFGVVVRDARRAVAALGAGERPTLRSRPDLTFLAVATLMTGLTGIPAYLVLDDLATALAGGAFVALIGGLLVVTGLLQYVTARRMGERADPDLPDALLVGALQGLAVLPGISRSGATAGALLLRGHDGESAFRLSFLLSIPAALGAALLVLADDGLPALSPEVALVALVTSALVGYLTIDALMRVVQRVAFWGVCIGLGVLAILGGAAVLLL